VGRFRKLIPANKRLIGLVIGIAALCYAGAMIPRNISCSPTDSVGAHFFFLKKSFKPSDLKEGTLVVMPLYTHIRPDCWPCMVVKYIKCDEGQNLETRDQQFFCNNVYLGTALTHSSKGVPVKAFEFNGSIPEGEFFAMGVSGDSYDSRYVGLEKKSNVKDIAVPLF